MTDSDMNDMNDMDDIKTGDAPEAEKPQGDKGDKDSKDSKGGKAGDETERPPTVAEGGTPVPGSKLSKEELNWLRRNIVKQLKTVRDPEIPVDIYELGLIYIIDIDDEKNVRIDMTLTAPACPVAGEMPRWVHDAVSKVEGVKSVGVNMVFDPPWSPELMTDEARLELGMF
jgi:FeS assembly SUF system protein